MFFFFKSSLKFFLRTNPYSSFYKYKLHVYKLDVNFKTFIYSTSCIYIGIFSNQKTYSNKKFKSILYKIKQTTY